MWEVFEKIIKKLKEIAIQEDAPIYEGDRESDNYIRCNNAIEAVEQIAAEYNNGWIPCSERMPENGKEVLCTDGKYIYLVEYDADIDGIIAWQPLPEPYQSEVEG